MAGFVIGKAKRSVCLVLKHHHPSKSEAAYCDWLSARKQGGEILDFKVWPSVRIPSIGKTWKIDFIVFEKDGTESYHESKGWNRSDESFKIKRDAFLICYPNVKLYVNKELYTGRPDRKRQRWTLAQVVKKNRKAAACRRRMYQARKDSQETGVIKEWVK